MPSLYQISTEAKNAIDTMLDAPDISKEVLDEIIENISGEVEDKQKNVAAYIMNVKMDVEAMQSYERNMRQRREILEKKIERLTDSLMASMKLHNKTEVGGAELTIKIKKNPPAIFIEDESLIPEKYFVVKESRAVDKKALKSALDNKVEIQGVSLKQSERIEIK